MNKHFSMVSNQMQTETMRYSFPLSNYQRYFKVNICTWHGGSEREGRRCKLVIGKSVN